MPSQRREERTIAQAAAQISASGASVEVLALTRDESLLATLREAMGAQQRIWHALDTDQAIELIMAGNVGVIVIDTLVTGVDSAAFCENLRAQFPDVILMVAGGIDDQTHLIKQITAGDVYRFLHKPVSPQRAHQFIETAVRRHLEGRTFTPLEVAPTAASRAFRRHWIIGTCAVVVIAAAATGYLLLPEDEPLYRPASSELPSTPDTAQASDTASAPPDDATNAAGATTSGAENFSTTPSMQEAGALTSPNAPASLAAPAPSAATAPSTAPASSPPSKAGEVAALLASASTALAAGRIIAPKGTSAVELYRAVLAAEPDNSEAQEGLDQSAAQLLSSAETALLEERIDDAARDIEAARGVRPNNVRLAFISAQLAKERERRLIAQAREAAAKGNHDRARVLIDRAMQGQRTPSPVLAEARKELEQLRRGDSVGNLLRLANERLKDNRLVEPAGDNARSYIEAALAADPNNAAALQARRALADQLLARGRQALNQRDPVAASSWLTQAEAMNADRAPLRAAQRDLQTLRQTTARGEQLTRLTTLLNERIAQDRLLEPAGDSATYYWQELRTVDSTHTALAPALQGIGTRLQQQARQGITTGKLDDAQRAIDEAGRLGYATAEMSTLQRDLAAAREHEAFLTNVVAANLIPRDKQVAPRYPQGAERRRIEGWVDMDFTIGVDGKVKNLVVRAAEPAGVFDEAARSALSQWIFRPVMRNGRAVEQRARLRLRFDVPD